MILSRTPAVNAGVVALHTLKLPRVTLDLPFSTGHASHGQALPRFSWLRNSPLCVNHLPIYRLLDIAPLFMGRAKPFSRKILFAHDF